MELKPQILYSDFGSLLRGLRERNELCDVVLVAKGMKVHAHSCVLVSQSSVIATIIQECLLSNSDWSVIHPLCIALDEQEASLDHSVIEAAENPLSHLVSFLYGGRTILPTDNIDQLLCYCTILGISNDIINSLENIKKEFTMNLTDPLVRSNVKGNKLSARDSVSGVVEAIADLQPIFEEKDKEEMVFDNFSLIASESCKKFITQNQNSFSDVETKGRIVTRMSVPRQKKYSVCHYCKCYFPKSRDLVQHVLDYEHFSEECPLCSMQIPDLQGQKIHFSHHNHNLPFFCLFCDLRFKTRADLAMHSPKHANSKQYSCGKCGKVFKWQNAMKAHLRTHSGLAHLCDVCGFSSNYLTTFKSHLQQHSGLRAFSCGIDGCNFKALRKTHLKDHMALHSEVRPHQCDVCGRSFAHARNMKRHMRLHALDVTLLMCSNLSGATCGFTTTRPDKLKNHLVKKHGVEGHLLGRDQISAAFIKSKDTLDTRLQEKAKKRQVVSCGEAFSANSDNGDNSCPLEGSTAGGGAELASSCLADVQSGMSASKLREMLLESPSRQSSNEEEIEANCSADAFVYEDESRPLSTPPGVTYLIDESKGESPRQNPQAVAVLTGGVDQDQLARILSSTGTTLAPSSVASGTVAFIDDDISLSGVTSSEAESIVVYDDTSDLGRRSAFLDSVVVSSANVKTGSDPCAPFGAEGGAFGSEGQHSTASYSVGDKVATMPDDGTVAGIQIMQLPEGPWDLFAA